MSDEAFPSSSAPGGDGALDAEILRHALRVAAEEASIVVVKSAHSAMIVEGADACAGILDARARLVALSTATPSARSDPRLHGLLVRRTTASASVLAE